MGRSDLQEVGVGGASNIKQWRKVNCIAACSVSLVAGSAGMAADVPARAREAPCCQSCSHWSRPWSVTAGGRPARLLVSPCRRVRNRRGAARRLACFCTNHRWRNAGLARSAHEAWQKRHAGQKRKPQSQWLALFATRLRRYRDIVPHEGEELGRGATDLSPVITRKRLLGMFECVGKAQPVRLACGPACDSTCV